MCEACLKRVFLLEGLSLGSLEERVDQHLAEISSTTSSSRNNHHHHQQQQQSLRLNVAAGALRNAEALLGDASARPRPFSEAVGAAPFTTALLLAPPAAAVEAAPPPAAGAWMYEVVLGSAGLMQLGYAWPLSPWDAENGVGDFPASYAFDGKRVRRWGNGSSAHYGEPWVAGDVIGCVLRLTGGSGGGGGSVEFFRNGAPLGTAFSAVAQRPFYAPGLSISGGERVFVNFGDACPFFYPLPGVAPVREPSRADADKARYLFGCARRLLLHGEDAHECALSEDDSVIALTQAFNTLFPLLLGSPYIVASELCPLLADLADRPQRLPALQRFVEFLEACLDPEQYARLLEAALGYFALVWRATTMHDAARQVSTGVASNATVPGISALRTFSAIISTAALPPLVVEGEYFHSLVEATLFMRDLTMSDLQKVYPHLWWESEALRLPESDHDAMRAESDMLLATFTAARGLQADIASSLAERNLLAPFLQQLVERNKGYSRTVLPPGLSSVTALTNIFYVLLRLVTGKYAVEDPATVPEILFFNTQGFRMDFSRVAGTPGHLMKELPPPSDLQSDIPLQWVLFDALAFLFNLAVARRMKQASQEFQLQAQGINHLDGMMTRLERAIVQGSGPLPRQIEEAKNSLRRDLEHVLRVCLWHDDSSFSAVEQSMLSSAVRTLVAALGSASKKSDLAFEWVPEAYFELAFEAFHSLRRFRRDGSSFGLLDDVNVKTTEALVTFSVEHMADGRIHSPNVKDLVQQSVLVMMQIGPFIPVFEQNEASRRLLIPNILEICKKDKQQLVIVAKLLLRLWVGKGFGMPAEREDFRGSAVFQAAFREHLRANVSTFEHLTDLVLDLANTTASEFGIGLGDVSQHYQGRAWGELEPALQRLIAIFETCVMLARTIELFALEMPDIFFARELNLIRVCEFVVFTLTRFTNGSTDTTAMALVARVAARVGGEQRLSRALIIAPLVGILASMWKQLSTAAHAALSKTPGYSLEMFTYATTQDWQSVLSPVVRNPVVDSYPVFNELVEFCKEKQVEAELAVPMSQSADGAASPSPAAAASAGTEDLEMSEDDLCSICCANPIDVEFVPCGHRSCHVCIERQMVKDPTCFFCKAQVTSVKPWSK